MTLTRLQPHRAYCRNDKSNVTEREALVPTSGMEFSMLVENVGRINFSNRTGLDTKGVCPPRRLNSCPSANGDGVP